MTLPNTSAARISGMTMKKVEDQTDGPDGQAQAIGELAAQPPGRSGNCE
jgi:hypothetical protein